MMFAHMYDARSGCGMAIGSKAGVVLFGWSCRRCWHCLSYVRHSQQGSGCFCSLPALFGCWRTGVWRPHVFARHHHTLKKSGGSMIERGVSLETCCVTGVMSRPFSRVHKHHHTAVSFTSLFCGGCLLSPSFACKCAYSKPWPAISCLLAFSVQLGHGHRSTRRKAQRVTCTWNKKKKKTRNFAPCTMK